jgi:2-oxoglutarate dehydrogenase E2 component (dihydrolipoamide succinyltransferase)
MVPNAENLTFRGVEADIKRLALARDGQITVDDMTGGTFTITNGGVLKYVEYTNHQSPQSEFGMHNIIERPIAVNGKVEIHPMMYVALSYDHRIIDGRESWFLGSCKRRKPNGIIDG